MKSGEKEGNKCRNEGMQKEKNEKNVEQKSAMNNKSCEERTLT